MLDCLPGSWKCFFLKSPDAETCPVWRNYIEPREPWSLYASPGSQWPTNWNKGYQARIAPRKRCGSHDMIIWRGPIGCGHFWWESSLIKRVSLVKPANQDRWIQYPDSTWTKKNLAWGKEAIQVRMIGPDLKVCETSWNASQGLPA